MSRSDIVTLSLKGRVAVIIGNWLEFYDFLVFTFFAVMIGDAFFPGLIDWTKEPMVPAWYQIAANVAAIAAILLLAPEPETVPQREAPIAAET